MASPSQTRSAGRRSGAEQLRADIDSGRTGDKVAYPDPAAVPLGADDEAAAQTPEQIIGAGAPLRPALQAEARKGTPAGTPATRSRSWIYIAAAVALLVVLLLLGTTMP